MFGFPGISIIAGVIFMGILISTVVRKFNLRRNKISLRALLVVITILCVLLAADQATDAVAKRITRSVVDAPRDFIHFSNQSNYPHKPREVVVTSTTDQTTLVDRLNFTRRILVNYTCKEYRNLNQVTLSECQGLLVVGDPSHSRKYHLKPVSFRETSASQIEKQQYDAREAGLARAF